MTEEEGHDLVQSVQDAVAFLTDDEIRGVLLGTLIYMELNTPGYTDELILKVLSARAGLIDLPHWEDEE